MVNHRGPEFAVTMMHVTEQLKPFFGTAQQPLLLTGSGTGAQEAAIVNMLSPGDRVLAATTGVFGDRFAAIAEAFGADVVRLEGEWGRPLTPEQVAEAVSANPGTRAVLLTHNETSTGVTNDIAGIGDSVRRASPDTTPLILVDGVSSIGALPFEMDRWGVDVAITGSQKAWMSPPGMAMIAVSQRGWEAHAEARMPRFYWDFTKARKNGEKHTTPFTPAVGVVHAIQEALRLMTEEGVAQVYARHQRIGEHVRRGILDVGLELFADPAVASNTVTAVRLPAGLDAGTIIKDLREQHHVVVGSGQERLKGLIFRIGHMGWVHEDDVQHLLDGLSRSLEEARVRQAV